MQRWQEADTDTATGWFWRADNEICILFCDVHNVNIDLSQLSSEILHVCVDGLKFYMYVWIDSGSQTYWETILHWDGFWNAKRDWSLRDKIWLLDHI